MEVHEVEHIEAEIAQVCGVSAVRARALVAMAKRLAELPETRAAFEGGELSGDQVAVVCRHAPAHTDAQMAEFAREATVSQLSRTLASDTFVEPERREGYEPEEQRRVSFGHRDDGWWQLWALLPADEGALVERALAVAEGEDPKARPTYADAFVAMADRSLGAVAATRSNAARTTVVVHVDGDRHGHLHLGPSLPDSLRRHLTCDGRVRAAVIGQGVITSVGRSQHIVPARTRLAVEERDRGCRVPGCARTRWLHCHHVVHWEDGGPTDTANLVALCGRHHRLHHLGQLGITGNADRPDGLVFTDQRGRVLAATGRPAPPGDLAITGTWRHPSGEHMQKACVQFAEPVPVGASAGNTWL